MRIVLRNTPINELDMFSKIYAFISPEHKRGDIHILNHTPKHKQLPSHHTWHWTSLTPYGGSYNIHLTLQAALDVVESDITIYEFENEDEFILWIIKVKDKFDLLNQIDEHKNYLSEIKEYIK